MKKTLLVLFFSLAVHCFAGSFTDPYSGLTFEIPQGFSLNEEQSSIGQEEKGWWYVFSNSDEATISIEIEKYDPNKSPNEHHKYQEAFDDIDSSNIICERLEFKEVDINGLEAINWKLQLLSTESDHVETLYLCDYLFMRSSFSFSINLMKKGSDSTSNEESESMMVSLLQSMQFTK